MVRPRPRLPGSRCRTCADQLCTWMVCAVPGCQRGRDRAGSVHTPVLIVGAASPGCPTATTARSGGGWGIDLEVLAFPIAARLADSDRRPGVAGWDAAHAWPPTAGLGANTGIQTPTAWPGGWPPRWSRARPGRDFSTPTTGSGGPSGGSLPGRGGPGPRPASRCRCTPSTSAWISPRPGRPPTARGRGALLVRPDGVVAGPSIGPSRPPPRAGVRRAVVNPQRRRRGHLGGAPASVKSSRSSKPPQASTLHAALTSRQSDPGNRKCSHDRATSHHHSHRWPPATDLGERAAAQRAGGGWA
jgi:hypothetical protein